MKLLTLPKFYESKKVTGFIRAMKQDKLKQIDAASVSRSNHVTLILLCDYHAVIIAVSFDPLRLCFGTVLTCCFEIS